MAHGSGAVQFALAQAQRQRHSRERELGQVLTRPLIDCRSHASRSFASGAVGPLSAADRLVDGVPLSEDAKAATVVETDPTELRQWAGAWVGVWGGTLNHVLPVACVTADGSAWVVYAIGGNPGLGYDRVGPATKRYCPDIRLA
jgi:hypothetical protein